MCYNGFFINFDYRGVMIINIFTWLKIHIISILSVFLTIAVISYVIDQRINPPFLKIFDGGIQNHLVWDTKGVCYFVRPYNGTTVYLVPVVDCNKS